MVTNPDYEIQVEDGMLFSSDLQTVRLPPLPQPQQPTAAMRGVSGHSLSLEPPARSLSSEPPPAAAVLHPKPKFFTPFQKPFAPRAASGATPTAAPTPMKRGASAPGVAHVPLRKSVHDMVARIQTHMLNNLMGRQSGRQAGKNKEDSGRPVSVAADRPDNPPLGSPLGPHVREMPIDVGDCVQVQARRVEACHHEDSESSDGEDDLPECRTAPRTALDSVLSSGLGPGLGLGLGPDYENVACWREAESRVDRLLVSDLVSDLPYRSRTGLYSPDVDPDFLDIPLANGHHGHGLNGHGLDGHGLNGHGINGHGLNGHGPNGHGLNGHGLNGHNQDAVRPNGVRSNGHPHPHTHSPAGTPDLEMEVHSHPYHHFPYSGGMYSPDHGDSGYSTRLGGSSNSKGTSPSLSGKNSMVSFRTSNQ